MSNPAIDIYRLTPAERMELIERLWESLAEDQLDLSPAQRDELVRRSAEVDDDVASDRPLGSPWSEIRARLVAKYGKR